MRRIVAGTVFLMVFVSVLISGAEIEVRVNNLDSEIEYLVVIFSQYDVTGGELDEAVRLECSPPSLAR